MSVGLLPRKMNNLFDVNPSSQQQVSRSTVLKLEMASLASIEFEAELRIRCKSTT